ncbi:MAG TPA: TolC family protein [Polyangiales bacterium]|jgi:outer membrane protein|nr:TolC family protein [Polyangiales bacterium]
MTRLALALLLLVLSDATAWAQTPPMAAGARTLSLQQALDTARAHAPELERARADVMAAEAHADVIEAPLLPQVSGNVGYQRGTANSASAAAAVGGNHSDFQTYDNWNFGVSATQLLYDFGKSRKAWRAAQAAADVRKHDERSALLGLELDVRLAYFAAGTQKALLAVARDTLANQQRHLEQIAAFVEVGTRPAIDLAQVKTDAANARLAVVRAENAYAVAKASLNEAMGAPGPTNFEVTDDILATVEGENAPLDQLVQQAVEARPELAAINAQIRAQELSIESIQGDYGPTLSAGTALTDGGRKLTGLAWNWNAGLTLSWQIFQGGVTKAKAREARAALSGLRADLEVRRKQIALAIEQSRLDVQGALAAVSAADEVVANAKERLNLAESRYAAGAGNIIELADAQLALSNAQTQRVRVDYDLASARAQLLQALGR